MKIAAIQHDVVQGDREATLRRLEQLVAAAAKAGARLAVLSEMFSTGFMTANCEPEPLDGPTKTWMHDLARQHDLWIAGSIPLASKEGSLPTNSLFVVGPDEQVHRYDKVHPFTYAREHERYARGSQRAVVADVDGLRLGLSICYDLRFADQYWDMARDVDAYLVVAAWPQSRRRHWRALLEARAIENQAYVIGVNRVGRSGEMEYSGDSAIVDPSGEVLVSAAWVETILLGTVEREVVADVRARFPFMQDRVE